MLINKRITICGPDYVNCKEKEEEEEEKEQFKTIY